MEGCQFTSLSADAVKSQGGEDDFGCYRAVNPVHRCVSNDDSTPRIVINDMIIMDRESLQLRYSSSYPPPSLPPCPRPSYQSRRFYSHVNLYFRTYMDNCQLKAQGAAGSSTREDNFENSKTFNLFHRCSSSDNSTTQWWLGNNRSRLKKYYIVTSLVAEHSFGSL